MSRINRKVNGGLVDDFDTHRVFHLYSHKLISSGFRVQGLPAFGGAVGDQGSKVITYLTEKRRIK